MYTSTLFLSFSVLGEGPGGGSWAPVSPALKVPSRPPVLISEAPLEEPLTRAPCFEALRSPSSTDNRTNDDSGSQNGAQMGTQNGAQKSCGQMNPKKHEDMNFIYYLLCLSHVKLPPKKLFLYQCWVLDLV